LYEQPERISTTKDDKIAVLEIFLNIEKPLL
jgi:hypothetical protein